MYIDAQPPSTVSILWQLPQYFVLSCGEIMVSITGLSFAYSQAPVSMKGVIMAMWLITVALGNLVVVVLTAITSTLNKTSDIYWMYTGLMLAFNFFFWVYTRKYVYELHLAPPSSTGDPHAQYPPDSPSANFANYESAYNWRSRYNSVDGNDTMASSASSETMTHLTYHGDQVDNYSREIGAL